MPATVEVKKHFGDSEVSTIEFEQAVEDLIAPSRESAKSRSHLLKQSVDLIVAYASHHGIPALTLSTIIDAITRPTTLDQTALTALIDHLYPAAKVPVYVICVVVNALGQGKHKPSATTQNRLLRWMIMIFDVLEDASVLGRLYAVLFNLVDMLSIRPYLCHLLAMITRRKHVKPFRIQLLLELSRSAGNDSALLGLLRTFKEYYPDVVLDQTTSKAATYAHPDPEWLDRLRIIQDSSLRLLEPTQREDSTFKVLRRGAKRSRVSVVPEIHTYRANETSTTLEEISGVRDFVEKLHNVDLPNQMVAVLDDPLLQNYILLTGNINSEARIDQWLALFFDVQLQMVEEIGSASKSLIEMLEKILSYTHRTKVLPKSAESFLTVYLHHWDGQENRALILSLLALLPLKSFEELQPKVFNELEGKILDNTVGSATALLNYYTDLLRHWAVLLLVDPPKNHSSGISQAPTIGSLTAHASLLSLSLLASFQPTQATISSILSYHETLAHTISHAPIHPQIRILTPIPQTIYLLTFLHPTLCTLSRLCSVLATYKRAFEAAMARPTASSPPEYPRNYVNSFNGFLMDICNLLWRSRAFNDTDTNALGCLLPPSMVPQLNNFLESLNPPQALPSLFSLSHHPALSAVSIAAFRELEDKAVEDGSGSGQGIEMRHAGPVTQRSLAMLGADGGVWIGWPEYRLEVLKWLGDLGVDGVKELMFCTMKHLMSKEKD